MADLAHHPEVLSLVPATSELFSSVHIFLRFSENVFCVSALRKNEGIFKIQLKYFAFITQI